MGRPLPDAELARRRRDEGVGPGATPGAAGDAEVVEDLGVRAPGHEAHTGERGGEGGERTAHVVSLDCGAIVDGWHGDSALTFVVGANDDNPAGAARVAARHAGEDPHLDEAGLIAAAGGDAVRSLVLATEGSMWAGIRALAAGKRLNDVGSQVEAALRTAGIANPADLMAMLGPLAALVPIVVLASWWGAGRRGAFRYLRKNLLFGEEVEAEPVGEAEADRELLVVTGLGDRSLTAGPAGRVFRGHQPGVGADRGATKP